MTEDEFLRRLDGHIEATSETLADLKDNLTELKAQNARGNELMEEFRRSQEDMRIELRQVSLRGQRVAEQFAAEVRASREERIQEGGKHRDALAEVSAVLRDLRAESRAGRDALLHILDELRGRGGPAAAGA
ncbi:MAG TPA: hypothetical protein VMY78_06130 [Solirubrobacteraceae bacterium]|nr:hypothetical protein [Solirubrobacteraceae bacterium]